MNSAERPTPTSVQHLPSSDAVARTPFIDASADWGLKGMKGNSDTYVTLFGRLPYTEDRTVHTDAVVRSPASLTLLKSA